MRAVLSSIGLAFVSYLATPRLAHAQVEVRSDTLLKWRSPAGVIPAGTTTSRSFRATFAIGYDSLQVPITLGWSVAPDAAGCRRVERLVMVATAVVPPVAIDSARIESLGCVNGPNESQVELLVLTYLRVLAVPGETTRIGGAHHVTGGGEVRKEW